MLKKITIISFIKIFSLNIFYNILNKSFLAHYCIKKCVADTQEFKNFFFFWQLLTEWPEFGLAGHIWFATILSVAHQK